MSNKNVRIRVRIQGLAEEIRDQDNTANNQGKIGGQRQFSVSIPIVELPRDEWDQRLADAAAVLQYGREVDNDSPPIPHTGDALVTGPTSATVYGVAELVQGIATDIWFERDATDFLDGYGDNYAADESPIAVVGLHSVHATLIGLTPGTRYAYRLRCDNATADKYGLTKFFTTPLV